MLFAVDVGNTNITVGLFDGKKLIKTFRITTGTARTSDEYGVYFVDWLRVRDIHVSEIDAVIIASVVPKVMHSLTSGIIKYLNIQPIIVAPGIKTGINIAIPEPKTLGADRLVDAVAAYKLYGGPVIVVDFGTATTHDLVLEGGVFHSGATSPGIRLAAAALLVRDCKASRNRNQETRYDSGKGYSQQYAGRCILWLCWSDRVYYPQDQGRVWTG